MRCGVWAVALVFASSGCSTLDQLAVGRTDRLQGAPFYVTYQPQSAGPVIVLPIETDPATRQDPVSASRDEALKPLLAAMNGALALTACCRFHAEPIRASGVPELYVGSLDGEQAPLGTGVERQPHEAYPPMIVHLSKPGSPWRSAVADLAARNGAGRVVLIRLTFTQFPKADRGAFGKKVVLGTDYEERIRVLSAVDKPVEVVALTGMVLDANGNVLRAGAEGILGADAPFWVQVLELGRDIDTEAIRRLTTEERRPDLPGTPLKWRAALDQLLEQLLSTP